MTVYLWLCFNGLMGALNSVLGDAFRLYRKYFKQILIMYSVQVCSVILILVLFALFWTVNHSLSSIPARNFYNSIDPALVDLQMQWWFPVFVAGIYIFTLLLYFMELVSTAVFVKYINLKEKKENPKVAVLLKQIYRRLPALLVISVISIIFYFLTAPSLFPLNLLILIVAVIISQAYFYVLLEDHKLGQAFKESTKVTKGRRIALYILWLLPLGFSPPVLGYAIWRWLTNKNK